jgi:two-component system, LytTR family, response regulator
MTMRLDTLIVDDEPLARTHLRELLSAHPDVHITGECGNGRDAVKMVRELEPSLVMLDIQMPELSGLDVVREIGASSMPAVIFVTAHDAYALDAFGVFAVGYLLKPVQPEQLQAALARVKSIQPPAIRDDAGMRLTDTATPPNGEGSDPERLAIRVDGRIIFLRIADIDWVEAMDNHVRLHLGTRTHVVRGTLTNLERRLAAGRFLRIHRSTLVNVNRVIEAQPWFGGDFVLILGDGTRLTSGRSHRPQVQRFLRQSL